MKIAIKNGRLIDPKNNIDAVQDVFIAAGKVVGIGQAPADFEANKSLDATGLIVSPGLVDMAVRLREPGLTYKATLESELEAAVAGGITSLACLPDTNPMLDEPGLVEMLNYRAKQLNLAHVYPLGALTKKLDGKQITEMNELSDKGCVGFSQADNSITDSSILLSTMKYAATYGFTLFLRAEDYFLSKDGVAHEGEIATRLGLKGIPVIAETIAISTMIQLASETGVRLHLCRLSSAEGVNLVRIAKKSGLKISCDVAAHQLHLTEHDIGFFNSHCHLTPPLRTERDKNALIAGLKDGTIDAICSDHCPVNDDAKLLPFAESERGATGLELLLPLTLKWATENKVSLKDAISKITSQAADNLGINAGNLSVGSDADICLFDANEYWQIMPKNLKSDGKNSPFLGLEIAGKVKRTLVHGNIVF